jgi:acetyl esterase/lipase
MFAPLRVAVASLVVVIAASRSSAADPEREMFIWPADNPANAGVQPAEVGSKDWMERIANGPSITPFIPDADKRTGAAVVICPGGGYAHLAMDHEGLQVGKWMRDRGVAGFVLRYRCGGGKNQQPAPLQDAQRAIRLVRSKAAEWGIDANRVGVLGFSAGGHLASTVDTMFDDGDPNAADPIDKLSSRPDFAVLVYPVISMQNGITHGGSRQNLLGRDVTDTLAAQWSTDQRVTDKTPPTFLVHASDDRAVPVKNSLLFYEACIAHGVPVEMHIYEAGGHGFGMRPGDLAANHWHEQLEPWLKKHGIVK